MSYVRFKEAAFGSSKAGLGTVGYRLYNADNTANGARVTVGITDRGAGYYGANVTFPDGFEGEIRWDTGEGTPKYAHEDITPGKDEYADAKTTTRALETTAQSILTESGSHPTLSEIEATTVLAKEATLSTVKIQTDKFLFDASNFVKAVQQGAVDILQSGADKVWTSASRSLTTFGTLVADMWAYATRALTTRIIGADTLPTSAEINTTLSTAHGAGSWEGGGSAPTVEQIDTQLTTSHGAGSWQTGGAGTGTNTVTITLTETGGTPKIVGATVAVKNNIDDTLLASLATDANGQAIFLLNNGTYKVYNTKLGSYSFTNPQTLVVSGNTNASYIGTPISVAAPAQPNTCRLFIWARNPDGTLMITLTGNIKITALPYKYSGAAHKGDEISFTKHADGYWYADIVYGATVVIYIPALGINTSQIVPSQTTKDIGDWL